MSIVNRAMTDQQKQTRRAGILRVAMQRFATTPYDTLSMADIAAETGVAKGTLYLYFHSKEELFLALYEQELDDWFDELDAALSGRQGAGSIEGLLQLVSESIARRPAFLRLIAILHTVLERNVDHATALRFKTRLRERVLHTGALLEQNLPFLQAGQGAELLLKIDALVIGFQHLAEPSDVVRQVLAAPDMALFQVRLDTQLLGTLRTLLMGLAYEARARQERQNAARRNS
ncbi:MAG TPA: TetR family transcriptional regulator [Gammaproteobacteria bacterium]|nr:TetR family transcriptional regulator [Gammaproteobacteria bacterium]